MKLDFNNGKGFIACVIPNTESNDFELSKKITAFEN